MERPLALNGTPEQNIASAYAVMNSIWRHWRKVYDGGGSFGLDLRTMAVQEPRAAKTFRYCQEVVFQARVQPGLPR